ncbi:high mobility group nucleosome-binding domain-containing protein 3-like [Nycticebus coucang]|uniref:high mobility group nucleosome-binding domain-containing protein 3-like n=1 Tax=Nycticebus coucang TaxID=9470 RepID=UPI00234D0793|nr:high mobility group nucleosome-binding domain-containing protein 3-like [Nycticebus coucang]
MKAKRKSPKKTEGKAESKVTKQEPTRQSAILSAKPALLKPEPTLRKTSAEAQKTESADNEGECVVMKNWVDFHSTHCPHPPPLSGSLSPAESRMFGNSLSGMGMA